MGRSHPDMADSKRATLITSHAYGPESNIVLMRLAAERTSAATDETTRLPTG